LDRNKIRSASGNGIDVTDAGEPGRPEAAQECRCAEE
jgi:hypothetical protein